MKKITQAKTAGFCFGVKRAVEMVYRLAEQTCFVKTLGPIIHNPQVVEDLSQKGVQAICTLDEASPQDTVVIRSHGVGQEVYDELINHHIHYIDATCPFVSKIHKIVREHSKKGDVIVIAGDKNHPEVLGIQGHSVSETYVIKDDIELLSCLEKIDHIEQKNVVLVAQTTFNTNFWRQCVEKNKKTIYKYHFF